MPFKELQLFHTVISSTTAQVVYTSPSSTTTVLKNIVCVNDTSDSVTVRIYHNQYSSTLSATTLVHPLTTIAGNSKLEIDTLWNIESTATGTFGVQCGTSAVLTVYANGAEII